jgi:hypothetical protein
MFIEPILYLDTNILLDVVDKRWIPSLTLVKRIEQEHWKCITSRFAFVEMLDIEHEECYINNKLAEGYPLSRIRGLLGNRNQKAQCLPKRDFEAVHAKLYDAQTTILSCVTFQYPTSKSFWDKVDLYCDTTEIAVADAMHLAFAKESGCNILVTRDRDFRITADDVIIAIPPEEIDIALAKMNKNSK